MTHLPKHTSESAATKDDIAVLGLRFNRMDKMQRNFLTVSFGALTVMTAIFAFITRI